jgi:hypothetical protein
MSEGLVDKLITQIQTDDSFDMVLSYVKQSLLSEGHVLENHQSVLHVLKVTIECIDKVKVKQNKKLMALGIIGVVVRESSIESSKKTMLLDLINNGTLQNTIDLIIDASRGKLKINKKTKLKFLKVAYKALFSCMNKEKSNSDSTPKPEPKPDLTVQGKAIEKPVSADENKTASETSVNTVEDVKEPDPKIDSQVEYCPIGNAVEALAEAEVQKAIDNAVEVVNANANANANEVAVAVVVADANANANQEDIVQAVIA